MVLKSLVLSNSKSYFITPMHFTIHSTLKVIFFLPLHLNILSLFFIYVSFSLSYLKQEQPPTTTTHKPSLAQLVATTHGRKLAVPKKFHIIPPITTAILIFFFFFFFFFKKKPPQTYTTNLHKSHKIAATHTTNHHWCYNRNPKPPKLKIISQSLRP